MIKYHFAHNVFINGAGKSDYSTPQVYEHQVKIQLDRMHRSRTGRALLTEIRKRTGTHSLTIVPYNNHKEDNAYASATDYQHATIKGGLERYNGDVKNSPYDKKAGHNVDETGLAILGADGKAITGLGGGSNSNVTYSPSTWYKHIHKDKGHKSSSGAQPDEILLHEMVHAVRQMRGIAESLYVGSNYDTEEEFFAILIANIYASELNRKVDIRSDHHGFKTLSHAQDTSEKFLPKKDPHDYHYQLVGKLTREEKCLCHALAHIHTAFNPIRRYYQLQHGHVHAH
jgi:hypothetical protein